MNRIITVLVTIFILLLLYIWISHVWGSDAPRHPQQIVDATQSTLGADDTSADVDTFLNTSPDVANDEKVLTNEKVVKQEPVAEPNTSETEEQAKPEPPKQEVKKPEPVKSAPVKNTPVKKEVVQEKKPAAAKTETKSKPAPATTPKATQPVVKKTSLPASIEGKHLVIAGNFVQMENANQRMAELKKAGFKDVEILNFDLSEYHTVCAGRFTDVNEARRLVKKLKDYHKIDAYVRVGN